MEIARETHQGLKRANNQDRFLVREFGPEALLLAVADGMGGEAAGDQAAQIAIESLEHFQSETSDPVLHLQSLFKQAPPFARTADPETSKCACLCPIEC